MNFILRSICVLFIGLTSVQSSSSRVLELSDKFIDIGKDGVWFVKFYAPWCAHCRRIEPIWAHVAQALYNTPIKVAKVDCTRFTAVATHFKVRAYPTIMFIKGPFWHEYSGEREKDEMVNYALRMAQPAVQIVSHADSYGFLKETHDIFFGYIGKQQGLLWEMFTIHAEKYQANSWFYGLSHEIVKSDLNPPNDTAVFVYKEEEIFFFTATPEMMQNKDTLNITLNKWVNSERFGFFPKITRSNINDLMDTEKFIVIAVVSENKLNEITQTERDFKDMMESIISDWLNGIEICILSGCDFTRQLKRVDELCFSKIAKVYKRTNLIVCHSENTQHIIDNRDLNIEGSKKHELHHRFQFGWMGNPELANSIAMSELAVPHLIVLNSTTSHHHIPDDDPILMTPEAVTLFLDQIHKEMAPIYGGNSWMVRFYRGFFEARITLINMWRGNPVLTALVFGLPLGFLSLICYSICCADILDADEEESSETHEKND